MDGLNSPTGREIGAEDPLVRDPLALSHLAFSFTNHCNLRCVYCPQGTHPDTFHAETPEAQIALIRDYVARHRVTKVSLGYYGETMLVPGWEDRFRPLLDLDVEVHFVSSFSRVMTPSEVAVVSRFHLIQISIDTVDPALLKQIRKAVDVRTILLNTHLIRSHVLAQDLPMPRLVWTGVLSDRVMEGLPDYVAMAISSGIREINFNDLADMGTNAAAVVRHPMDMPADAFARGYAALWRAKRLAARHGVLMLVQEQALLDRHARRVFGRAGHPDTGRILLDAGDIDPERPVYIYGAGAAGHALRGRLGNVPVRAFIDSRRGGEMDGLPILPLDDYVTVATADDQILIASMYVDEIEAGLLARGITTYMRADHFAQGGVLAGGVLASVAVSAPPSSEDRGHVRQGIQGAYSYAEDAAYELPAGRTRLCTAPWTDLYLDPKGEAYSCCVRGEVMGLLRPAEGMDIEAIRRGLAYRELRRQLLTGQDLPVECRRCRGYAAVEPAELRTVLEALPLSPPQA